ncbi:MAG: cyclic nucleotide-binding domain-containing protein [Proteobacteria bacterium]|nr:cyclic nucleotide-binding domain-containing protein [Pseudomonadota bacterium]
MIEHGAATVLSAGTDRCCDLVLLPEHGVFALSAGGGRTGAWAARRCLEVVRRHADALAAAADAAEHDPAAGPALLERLQAVFDDASWALHEESHATGEATRGELGLAIVRPGMAWIGMSGQCAALIANADGLQRLDHSGGPLRLGRVPLGVHTSAEPALLRHALGNDDTLMLGSSTRLHLLTYSESGHLDCQRLVDRVATGLVGPNGEGAAIAPRGGGPATGPDVLAAARRTSLLSELDPAAVRLLAPYLLESRLESGVQVFGEGDPGDRLYLLLDGSVRVHRADTELVDLSTGDHFGELALHLEGVRTASVVTTSPCWLTSLHRRHLRDLEERRPDVAVLLQRRLLGHLAARLRELTVRVSE